MYIFFQKIKHCIQSHGNNTQDHNGHKNPGEFKSLASIDDKISETFSGTDELADDNTHQTETNVYFHNTDDQRKEAGRMIFVSFSFCGLPEFQSVLVFPDLPGRNRSTD